MKKIITFLVVTLIASNAFGKVVITSKFTHFSEKDSIIKVQLEGQEKILTILNGIKGSIIQNRNTVQTKINLEIEKYANINSNLEEIKESINSNRDTLKHAINIVFDTIKENPKDSRCNFCSILGSILGALLSGGVAISIFSQGRKNDKKNEKKKLIDYGEEVYTLVKNIVVNSKKQVELLNGLITSIRAKPYTHGNYTHISFNLLKRAQSFDTTHTFNTFKALQLEKMSYIKFYTSIDFLLELFTDIDSDYHKNNSEMITPLSNSFIKLRQEILILATNYTEGKRKESKIDDPLYIYLDQLVIEYITSQTDPKVIDLKYDEEILISPLKIQLLEKFRDYNITNDLLTLAKQAGDIYTTITTENVKFADVLASQLGPIKDNIEKLKLIESELNLKYS